MAIDDEVFVGGLLVLADARLQDWGALEIGETIREIVSRRFQGFGALDSGLGGRIDDRSSSVVGDLEAAPLVAGDAYMNVVP